MDVISLNTIFPPKPNTLRQLFNVDKPVIGVLHLKPLPGAPHYRGDALQEVIDFAMQDAQAYRAGGVDGLIVENGWDIPFSKPEDIGFETVAGMTAVAQIIIREICLPTGINCLANAAIPALAVAKATDAQFVRVNQWVNAYVANEGFIEGAAAKALRYRSNIKADDIKIFADVHVKHGSHSIIADRNLAQQTQDAIWFDADVLIATGNRTGDPTPISEIEGIKSNTELSVIVGSGTNAANANEIFRTADGAIIGSSLKKDGLWWNPVDKNRVEELMSLVVQIREQVVQK